MTGRAALLLLLCLVALAGCSSCFVDALPGQTGRDPGVPLDCDPLPGK